MTTRWWTLRVPPLHPERPLLLGRGALWAFGMTTVAGLVGALSVLVLRGDAPAAPLAAAVACLGSFALGATWSRGDRPGLLTYFALQTVLAAAAAGFSGGRTGMLFMPLISQACLVLPAAGVATVFTGWGLLFLGSLASPTPVGLAQQALSYLVAGAFTWLFTGLTMREREARTEVERLAVELAEANARLERLAVERERVRLAHEIHDGLGHALTAARVQLEAARVLFEREPPRAKAGLETASRLIQEGLDDVRQSVRALRETAGTPASLPERVARLCEDGTPAATFAVVGAPRRLAPSLEHALFRAAQEGLTNVRRHAGASRAAVRLTFSPASVQLEVEDDGRGPGDAAPGVGLGGLAERAQRHGGTSEVLPRPGGGTLLRLAVPTGSGHGDPGPGEP